MSEYSSISFFLFIGALIAGGAILLSSLIAYKTKKTAKKGQAYECGEEPFSNARIQFRVGFYIFALLFLVFDIESLFLFPCVKIFNSVVQGDISGISPTLIFAELSVFVLILVSGLAYAWKKGALKWE